MSAKFRSYLTKSQDAFLCELERDGLPQRTRSKQENVMFSRFLKDELWGSDGITISGREYVRELKAEAERQLAKQPPMTLF